MPHSRAAPQMNIFAVMLTSIYPSSFQLLISINVLALIIVGGILSAILTGAIHLPWLSRQSKQDDVPPADASSTGGSSSSSSGH